MTEVTGAEVPRRHGALWSRALALVVVVALVAAACGGNGNSQTETESAPPEATEPTVDSGADENDEADETVTENPDAPAADEAVSLGLDVPANPASVDITVDEATGTSAVIGAAGGTFSATAPDGSEYTLDIPEGALFSDIEISMTPITAVNGEAIGNTFIAGVELQPSGLHLLGAANLSISRPGIEGAVGWGSTAGEDFHLTPADLAGGTATMPVFHFSDFGLAERQVLEIIRGQGFTPEDLDARLRHALATAPDEAAMRLAIGIAEAESSLATVIAEGTTIDGLLPDEAGQVYAIFEAWTSDVVTHIGRIIVVAERRGWGPDTPGFDDLRSAFYELVDSWFATTDTLVVQQTELCQDGNIEAGFRILRQGLIGSYMLVLDAWFDGDTDADYLEAVVDAYLYPWADASANCALLGLNWQARIVTTGSGFRSDISIGAEARNGVTEDFDALDWLLSRGERPRGESFTLSFPSLPIDTDLEVQWVEGFFAQPILNCSPANGRVQLEYEGLEVHIPNVGNIGDVVIDPNQPFFVRVRILEPITLGCNPLSGIGAEFAYAFHLGALEYLNGSFDVNGDWHFQMFYEPGAGEVARFEQGFPVDGEGVIIDGPEFEFGTGKFELWQLVTVFHSGSG